jgi:DNA (cytosine-5)-methyltransferase 1
MSIDFTDIFCGAGGSSIGLVAAGLDLKLAANHWDRAIETHSANFPNADHLIADVSNYDMRRLPRTQVLWASPECTWHSPAGGSKSQEQIRAQLDLFEDYVPNAAGVRSRATAFDVIRAAEVHRYKVIIVENVVEFATRWELFDWWIAGLKNLGYTVQLISVSSAHVGNANNAPAPQWRDRLYVYCTVPARSLGAPPATRPSPPCSPGDARADARSANTASSTTTAAPTSPAATSSSSRSSSRPRRSSTGRTSEPASATARTTARNRSSPRHCAASKPASTCSPNPR